MLAADVLYLLLMVLPLGFILATLVKKMLKFSSLTQEPEFQASKWGVIAPILIVALSYALVVYLLAPIFFSGLHELVFKGEGESLDAWVNRTHIYFFYTVIVSFVQLIAVFWYVQRKGGSLRSLGLRALEARYVGYGVIAYGCYFLIFFASLFLLQILIPALDQNQQQQIGFQTAQGSELIFAFISLVILPPITEEILMRGFLYRAVAARTSVVFSTIVVSALFAVAHLQLGSGALPLWIAAVDTFILSCVLIYLYRRTGSLWPAVVTHMVKNSIAFAYIFILQR